MARVLVTGSHGMLGGELVDCLSRSFDVVGVDVDEFDISDRRATAAAVADVSPDVVVNCAAYTDVDGAESNRDEAFAVNAAGAGSVAKASRAVDAYLIHVSTDYVFDGTKARPYTESDGPCPIGAYGESKLAGEVEVREAGGRHLIIRTAWLYGHRGPNFVETVLRLARSQENLTIVDDQVGSPTNAADLSTVIKDLIPVRATGIVNATNAGHCSWYEFAGEVLTAAGVEDVTLEPVKTTDFPRPASRPPYSVLSMERLSSLLGWIPRPWQEALSEYIAER